MTDRLRHNANLVDALGSAFRSGDHGLKTVPALLRRVLAEESWREFITQRGEVVKHERFSDFVTSAPLRGIGASLGLIRRIVEADRETLDLFDRALQAGGRPGERTDLVNNINQVNRPDPPRGTSKDYALRKLRKDAPEFHARVLAGELTPHAAMIEAGFRPPSFTLRATSPESIAETLRRKLPADVLREVSRLLAEVA